MNSADLTRFSGIEFNPEFERALECIQAGKNVLVTGKAGTGKSTLLKYFRETQDPLPPVVAPTGIAALNVGGLTIHKFFGFQRDVAPQAILDGKHKVNKRHLKNLKMLIIDEVSMVRADLFDCVANVLAKYGPSRGELFGGVQMVLIGDLFQLDPVLAESEAEWWYEHHGYKTKFFFSAKAMEHCDLEIVELEKVYRQKDAEFVDLLNDVRSDTLTKDGLAKLNERVDSDFDPPPSSAYVVLTTKNDKAERINSKKLDGLDGELYEFEALVVGDIQESDWGNIDKLLCFKVGAKVIMTNNDSAQRWVNGTIGIVQEVLCDETGVRVLVETLDPTDQIMVHPHCFEISRVSPGKRGLKTELLGTITQFPFKLAWAITVHRSQGQTLSNVIVDPHGGFFADGHLYVALSRCTSFEGLCLWKALRTTDLKVSTQVARYLANKTKRTEVRKEGGVAFLGIKTTGFQNRATNYDKVLEIGVVVKQPNDEVIRFSSFIAPMTDVGSFEQHRISPGDLSLAPTLTEAWPLFARRLHDNTLVACGLDQVLRFIRTHLKSENVLIPMVGGVCLEEEMGRPFDDSCANLGIHVDSGSSALDIAEATAEIWNSHQSPLSLAPQFDGSEHFDQPSRLLARYPVEAMSEVEKYLEKAGDVTLDRETAYCDTVACLCAVPGFDKGRLRHRLQAARKHFTLSSGSVNEKHVRLVSSLMDAARRDSRIDEDEQSYIEAIRYVLDVDGPCITGSDPTKNVELKKGMKVYFSGEFIHPLTGRKIKKSELREPAGAWGLENVDRLTKKNCDLLVVYETASMSRAAKSARKWSIPILSMEEFCERIDFDLSSLA